MASATRAQYLERFSRDEWPWNIVDAKEVAAAYDAIEASGEQVHPVFVTVLAPSSIHQSLHIWAFGAEEQKVADREPMTVDEWMTAYSTEKRLEDLERWFDEFPCRDIFCESDCDYCRVKRGWHPADEPAIAKILESTEEVVRDRPAPDEGTIRCISRSELDWGWERERVKRSQPPRDPLSAEDRVDETKYRRSVEFLVSEGVMLVHSSESGDVRPHRTKDDPVFQLKPWRPERAAAAKFLRYVRAASTPGDAWDRAILPNAGDPNSMADSDWTHLQRIYLAWKADGEVPPPPAEWGGDPAFQGYKATNIAHLLRELQEM